MNGALVIFVGVAPFFLDGKPLTVESDIYETEPVSLLSVINLIQMSETDEVEANYLNSSKSDRAEEYQKLTQKLKFLETIEMNDDIKANLFIFDVQIAMDAKNKAIEAEEANKRKRQRLGSFVLALAQPSPAPAPCQSGSFFNFFRPRSNSSPR